MATELNISKACKDAGLEVMEQVLDIVHNREDVPVETLNALTADGVYALYEMFVGPCVDRVEKYLLDNSNV